MGTISFQVIETGQTNATKVFTLADAQIDRIVLAYQIPANAFINATATRAQVITYWATQQMNATVQYVRDIETAAAVAAAAAGVSPITPT